MTDGPFPKRLGVNYMAARFIIDHGFPVNMKGRSEEKE